MKACSTSQLPARRRRNPAAVGLFLVVCLALTTARAQAGQATLQPIQGLTCRCDFDPVEQVFKLMVQWTNPVEEPFEEIHVLLDGQPIVVLPGINEAVEIPLPQEQIGTHLVSVFGVRGGETSPPVDCTAECSPAPAVEHLACACGFDSTAGELFLQAQWQNPAGVMYDFFRVFLDNVEIDQIPGGEQGYGLPLQAANAGPHQIGIVGVLAGMEAPAAECIVNCDPPPPPVDALQCACDFDSDTGMFRLGAQWQNPQVVQYDAIRVLLDGVDIDVLAGDAQTFETDVPLEMSGDHTLTIIGVEDGRESTPVDCTTACELPLEAVANLTCVCTFLINEGGFLVRLEWVLPENAFFDAIEVFFDAVPPIALPGDAVDFEIQLAGNLPAVHNVAVVGLRGGQLGPPAQCAVECEPIPLPVAQIEAPDQVLLPLGGPVEVLFDGSTSTDPAGAKALRYFWELAGDPDPSVTILQPKQVFTRVVFDESGTFLIQLTVFGGSNFSIRVTTQKTIAVVEQAFVDGTAPAISELPSTSLFTVAGRPFKRTLALLEGSGPLAFSILKLPKGLTFDERTLTLSWVPPLTAANQVHPFEIQVQNEFGQATLDVVITVLDPGEPAGLYELAMPDVGRGEGASVTDAPIALLDRGAFEPPLDLFLQLGDAPECAVSAVVPDEGPGEGDRFAGVRFDPACAAAGAGGVGGGGAGLGEGAGVGGGAGGGVYLSGSSATSFAEAVDNDFTVEIWLSNVPAEQPAADPDVTAFAFAMADDTSSDSNWLIAAGDDGRYFASVSTDAAESPTISTTADFSDSDAHHLVFVREGNTHRLFVDGVLAAEALVEAAELDWDPNFAFLLGNNGPQTRPFAGDVLLAGAYPEALGGTLIEFLFELGPVVPQESDVPAPIADICPDPREVNRGTVEADGSLSSSGLEGQGGGAGGGAGVTACVALLRPLEWELSASPAKDGLEIQPAAGEEECMRRVEIAYQREAGLFDLDVTLTVTQVPVRGVVRTAVATKGISLPTPEFQRGHVNADLVIDLGDPVALLFHLFFAGGVEPTCLDAADSNDDGDVDVSDSLHLLNFLFRSGVPPASPFVECGFDAGAVDTLDCQSEVCP